MLSVTFTKLVALSLLALTSCVSALGPTAVPLGTAGNYVVLAKSGVSTVPSSLITGDIGLSPASSTFLTGFSQTLSPTTQFSTSIQVVGSLFAADYTSPTPSVLTTAVLNMQTAYVNAATRANPNFLNLASGGIGGLTLQPGLYKWTSGVLLSTSITISGSSLDTWIFQVAGTLTAAPGVKMILTGGALPRNIVWVVAGAVDIGSSANVQGVLLAATSVTLKTGATMNGRILSQTGVALQKVTSTDICVVFIEIEWIMFSVLLCLYFISKS